MSGRGLPGNRTDVVRVAAGVAGVVAAHAFDYLVLYPDTGRRAQVLAASGHRYWPVAISAATIGTVIAAAAAGVRGASRSSGDATTGFRDRFAALARFQVGLFAAVEVSERVAAHVSPAGLVQQRSFALGLVLQLIVAAVVVAVLAGIEKLVHGVAVALAGACGNRFPPTPMVPVRLFDAVPAERELRARPRGPPALAV